MVRKLKLFLLTTSLIFLLILPLHSLGLGGAFNFTPKLLDSGTVYTAGLTFCLKDETLPLQFFLATNINFTNSAFNFFTALDYPFYSILTKNALEFSTSLGAGVGFMVSTSSFLLEIAPRLSLSLSKHLYDGFLEPFISFTLQPSFYLNPSTSSLLPLLEFPIEIGVRIWD